MAETTTVPEGYDTASKSIVYENTAFRSILEAQWAVFFDMMHIKWEYEMHALDIGKGKVYIPDFYLPELDLYVEAKGTWKRLKIDLPKMLAALKLNKTTRIILVTPNRLGDLLFGEHWDSIMAFPLLYVDGDAVRVARSFLARVGDRERTGWYEYHPELVTSCDADYQKLIDEDQGFFNNPDAWENIDFNDLHEAASYLFIPYDFKCNTELYKCSDIMYERCRGLERSNYARHEAFNSYYNDRKKRFYVGTTVYASDGNVYYFDHESRHQAARRLVDSIFKYEHQFEQVIKAYEEGREIPDDGDDYEKVRDAIKYRINKLNYIINRRSDLY